MGEQEEEDHDLDIHSQQGLSVMLSASSSSLSSNESVDAAMTDQDFDPSAELAPYLGEESPHEVQETEKPFESDELPAKRRKLA